MKMYVSKHALTGNGKLPQRSGELSVSGTCFHPHGGSFWDGLTVDKDCHKTADAAIADAERRRASKMASLERQLAKLRALTFTVEG